MKFLFVIILVLVGGRISGGRVKEYSGETVGAKELCEYKISLSPGRGRW